MATVVPPVTQDVTSSKGPTAMVFMNMGGPLRTKDVGVFLSRLFVGLIKLHRRNPPFQLTSFSLRPTKISFP